MKIFLAIPTINKLHPTIFKALFEVTKNTKHDIQLFMISEQPVDVARNKCVNAFLHTDCEVLWFLDEDQLPSVDVLDLLENDFDIIAPLTYIYQGISLIPNLWMIEKGKRIIKKTDGKQLEQVDACGMGCVFIKRKVLETMNKPYFKTILDEFSSKVIMSETFYFFIGCKGKKFKTLVDPRMNCGHIKDFNLDIVAYQMNKVAHNYIKLIEELKK